MLLVLLQMGLLQTRRRWSSLWAQRFAAARVADELVVWVYQLAGETNGSASKRVSKRVDQPCLLVLTGTRSQQPCSHLSSSLPVTPLNICQSRPLTSQTR